MAGFVFAHESGDLRDDGVAHQRLAEAERGERDALDEDLHPEERHVDVLVAQHVVEQAVQRRGDGVVEPDPVEVALVGLDVTSLVGDLRGGVVLVVDRLGGGADLGGGDERALLAVHELAHEPRDRAGRARGDCRRWSAWSRTGSPLSWSRHSMAAKRGRCR